MKTKMWSLAVACLCFGITCDVVAQQKKDPNTKQRTNINTRQKTPVKVIEYIPGKWVLQSVYRGNKNVSATDTLAGAETIEFNREGRYISYAGNEKIDSGAYRINEEHSYLYMASEDDNERSTNWHVSFDDNGNMIMKIRDTGTNAPNLSYVYRKEETATTSNRD